MKIVSFNINGIRARPHQLDALMEIHSPDIIGLQETKVHDPEFPVEMAEKHGLHLVRHGQKGHYGVALLSKVAPLEEWCGMPGDAEDEQRRLIRARFALPGSEEGLWVYNGYFPQGESRHHEVKFPYKERFYRRLTELIHGSHSPQTPLVVMGDLNISPQDTDIGIGESNRKRWLRDGKCSFLPEEREWLHRLVSWGLHDSYRKVHGDRDDLYSWFDYRSRGFDDDPKRGLRIDHIWVTQPLLDSLGDAGIDYRIRGMERPSDHCPVWARFQV